MAYTPSLKDLPGAIGKYQPSFADIPESAMESGGSTSDMWQDIQGFTNPTQSPGFNDLSQQEKLQRIALSQALNQLERGPGQVQPGTYESKPARLLASTIPSLLMPEIGLGSKALTYGANALGRIGSGTTGNLAYEAPDINNQQQLQEALKHNLTWNALLEGATTPFRLAGKLAETFNPLKYTGQKVETIRKEFNAAKEAQKAAYAPVTEQYGNSLVTTTPKKLLAFDKADLKYFTPDVKKAYTEFVEEPIFSNLHKLQSQMGKDWARLATNPNKINTAQVLNKSRESIRKKIQGFLGQDAEALALYNKGTAITKNQVMPYQANKTLKKITEGVKEEISPAQLSNAIKQGTEKVIYGQGKNAMAAIPKGHPLHNHMNDLENAINYGKAMKTAVPSATGAAIGEFLHPGGGGIIGGAAGLGAGQLGGLASKFGTPTASEFIQNPWVTNQMSYINPLYYGIGRATIGAGQGNK